MRMLALVLGLALASSALADDAINVTLPPAQELRAQAIGKQLRCPVCQGMSIADSPSEMARAQLDMVRRLVQQGKTDQQIKDFFVARYGEWILLKPARHGFAGLVWILPVLVLLGGGVLIAQVMRRPASPPQTPSPETDPAQDAAPADPDDPYLKAVRAELEK